MNFRFFDYLMGSAPEASPEFRFEKGREHSEKILINRDENKWFSTFV